MALTLNNEWFMNCIEEAADFKQETAICKAMKQTVQLHALD